MITRTRCKRCRCRAGFRSSGATSVRPWSRSRAPPASWVLEVAVTSSPKVALKAPFHLTGTLLSMTSPAAPALKAFGLDRERASAAVGQRDVAGWKARKIGRRTAGDPAQGAEAVRHVATTRKRHDVVDQRRKGCDLLQHGWRKRQRSRPKPCGLACPVLDCR